MSLEHAELLAWARAHVSRHGIIHGEAILNHAVEIGLGSTVIEHAERVVRRLVADGDARWDHPAPTPSQRVLGGGGLNVRAGTKHWNEALMRRAPGFELMWYLTSGRRATILDEGH